ncbi:MAG: O-antigen ligase [Psychroserpens sp.]|jgi:O-antigen ligase
MVLKINNYSFTKFVFIFFLFEMLLIQNTLFKLPFGSIFLYISLGLMIICLFHNAKQIANNTPLPINIFSLILLLYYLLFDLGSLSGFLYLISKITTLLFISFFAYLILDKKDEKPFYMIKNILLVFVALSALLPDFDGARATGIFGNANELGSVTLVAFLLVMNLNSKLLVFIVSVLLCTFVILTTQSRTAFVGMLLVFAFSHKLSKKTKVLTIVIFAIILSVFTFTLGSLERFKGGDLTNTRDSEWQAASYVITKKPWVGSGLSSYDGQSKLFPHVYDENKALGAHNGYLSLCIMMGIPLTVLLISFLIFPFSRLFKFNKLSKDHVFVLSTSGAILLFVLGITETIFSGINSLSSNLYFLFYVCFLHISGKAKYKI